MKSNALVIGSIVVLVVILLAVLALVVDPAFRVALGISKAPTATMATTTPNSFRGKRGGLTRGSIEILNDNGFTLTLEDGTTKNIIVTATTSIENFTSGSASSTPISSDQLSVGEQVSVVGVANEDGSIAATRVLTGTLPARRMRNSGATSTPSHT